MQIVQNKALSFRTRNPHKYSCIPKHHVAPVAGGYEVTVFWGLDEVRVLRNLGVKDAPSPIERDYNWPGKYKPMQHQRVTAGFLTLNRRAFVLSSPGTGKTLAALWAADYLMKRGYIRRVLIVCPLSIMQSAWVGDMTSSVLHRSVAIAHHADKARREKIVRGDFEFVVINYDGLKLMSRAIIEDGRFDLVIVDECSSYSDPGTGRWKALHSILRHDSLLWMMTGTPAAQSPMQAFGLAKLVNPSAVPEYKTAWRDKVMYKVTTFKYVPKPGAKEAVHAALQPAIRFTKEQCLDLPPVVLQVRNVELTAQQLKYYKLLKSQQLAMAAGETISAVNKAVLVGKLLQISAGAALTETGGVIEFDATPRLRVLREVIDETDNKVIIFAMFRASIRQIMDYLHKHGIKAEEIHGGVAAGKRGDIIQRFQYSADPQVLVMQPQATAHGITLTAADTVVFFGPLMSVEQYTQAIARADRKGQTADHVTVVHIQSSPIEVRMFTALNEKVDDNTLLTRMFDNEMEVHDK